VGGLLVYLIIERLLLLALSLKLIYIQGFIRLDDFSKAPAEAVTRTLQRGWEVLIGADPVYLDYGHILTFLPLLGLLIVVGQLLWRGPMKTSQRLLAGAVLVAALAMVMIPILVSAGTVPTRALNSWIPISAFLAGAALSRAGRFRKVLCGVLAATLLVSVWVSVSLFYTDHLARQRDELLAGRIMNRVDNLPNSPPTPIPFVVIGANQWKASGSFRKLDIFGDSFFDSSHEGGNAWRVAAYLQLLGVDTLEPHRLEEINPQRQVVEAMPIWPASGSVAMVEGILVIKLGPLPPT
jgi:hypothetical protein